MSARGVSGRVLLAVLLGSATLAVTGPPHLPEADGLTVGGAGTSLILSLTGLACWAAVMGLTVSAAMEWTRDGQRRPRLPGSDRMRRAIVVAMAGLLVLVGGLLRWTGGYHVCCGGAGTLQEVLRLAH